MNIFKAVSILVLLVLSGLKAQARIFSVDEESFGAYFRATRGSTQFTNTLLSKSNGTTGNPVTLDTEMNYNFSGEMGVVYANKRLAWRIGIESILPPAISDRKGTLADGTEVYRVTSEVSVIMPKMLLEVNLWRWPISKVYIYGGAGAANLVGRNSYVFTASGTTTYGVADYYEDLRGVAVMGEGGLGYEKLMFDTTTIAIEGGYRSINFTKITHNKDVTTMNGAVVKGDKALDTDGNDRGINLGGLYASVSFRIWIY